jgi:hypothetical protein
MRAGTAPRICPTPKANVLSVELGTRRSFAMADSGRLEMCAPLKLGARSSSSAQRAGGAAADLGAGVSMTCAEIVGEKGVSRYQMMTAVPKDKVSYASRGTAVTLDVAAPVDNVCPNDRGRGNWRDVRPFSAPAARSNPG